ncbi:MAG: hypothetical protein JW790_05350 [Dehalococcoidales bacterium]|nr:hypothetical protein [Dehalococcoidales bacterium]
MPGTKFYPLILATLFLALLLGGCSQWFETPPTSSSEPTPPATTQPETAPESPPADTTVDSAAEARDALLQYLREYNPESAPPEDAAWQEDEATEPAAEGTATYNYSYGQWLVTVSYPLAAQETAAYEIELSNAESGWYWQGTVAKDGEIEETVSARQITQEMSRQVAEDFVRSSPTFSFDGIEPSLTLSETLIGKCPFCWLFVFDFDCSHPGYGDRSGLSLAQVITHHQASIVIEQLGIRSATIDDEWDMLTQTYLGGGPSGIWTGVWECTFSVYGYGGFDIVVTLSQDGDQVTGSYDWENGITEGEVTGNVLRGMWSEGPSYAPPKDAGEIEFTISQDGNSFTGLWKYADSEDWSGPWDGVKAD